MHIAHDMNVFMDSKHKTFFVDIPPVNRDIFRRKIRYKNSGHPEWDTIRIDNPKSSYTFPFLSKNC